MRCCIFCFGAEPIVAPVCEGNPGLGCTYGLGHEFPATAPIAKAPTRDPKRALCLTCGLHPKNPASSINGCAHRYSEAE
jgi:hypothetical protein